MRGEGVRHGDTEGTEKESLGVQKFKSLRGDGKR